MSLASTSIKNPVMAWMLMLSLILFGFLSFTKMGVSQLPDVDFPMAMVNVTYEGAAPEVMELDVIDPLESALMGVEGVKSINSSAKLGSATISVEFDLNKNIDIAVTEIQTKINQASKQLPKNIDPPTISKVNPEDRPIFWLSVTSTELSPRDLMVYVRDELKDKFQTLPGVADIYLGGYVEPNVRVWVSNEKLNQHELTVNDIITAIQSEHNEAPSGYLENQTSETNVRTMGEAKSVEELGKISLSRRGGAVIFSPHKLNEVASIEEGLADVRRKSRVMGKNAIGLGIRKQRGSNAVDVAKAVKAKIADIQKRLPKHMEIGINFDSTEFIEEAVHELNFNMMMSAILTAIVCWIFLGNISSTINVILAIPTSILGSFIILEKLGFTLNTFTLLALSLSIGIVVDDAIMVLENIFRHFEHGKDKVKASLEGGDEISFAALAATVAIIAIFLPVAFMDGIIGKYFFQFGVTISVAVGLSYLEAMTLTPMRCSKLMPDDSNRGKIGKVMDRFFDRCMELYKSSLDFVLHHPWKTMIISVIFVLLSFGIIKFLRKELVPAQDTGSFLIRLKTKEGSSIEFTDHKVEEMEKYFLSRKEIKRFFVAIGGFGGGESNTAMMFVTLKPKTERDLSMQKLLDVYRAHFKSFDGGKVFIQDTSTGGFSATGRGFPIEITITGNNWAKLAESAKSIMAKMNKKGLFTDVDTDYKESVKEIHIIPNREKCREFSVSVQEINKTISSLVGGVIASRFSKDGHRYDIRVKLLDQEKKSVNDFKKIMVRNNRGELIRLSEIVSIQDESGVQSITRINRKRAISIYSGVATGASQSDALQAVESIAKETLAEGQELIPSGNSESFKQTFRSLMFALILGIVIAYMVLGSQFNSFLDPVVVLAALPFSFAGAFLGLWLMGQSINLYSMIGLILLMGLVKKNSILLVDFTKQKMKDEGLDVISALKAACPERLRPILMTTFSTIAGAIPAALSLGPGAESLSPMAVSIIGGMITSTVLTLIVVPPFYLLGSKLKRTKAS